MATKFFEIDGKNIRGKHYVTAGEDKIQFEGHGGPIYAYYESMNYTRALVGEESMHANHPYRVCESAPLGDYTLSTVPPDCMSGMGDPQPTNGKLRVGS